MQCAVAAEKQQQPWPLIIDDRAAGAGARLSLLLLSAFVSPFVSFPSLPLLQSRPSLSVGGKSSFNATSKRSIHPPPPPSPSPTKPPVCQSPTSP